MQAKKIVNIPSLISDYYTLAPNPDDKTQQVAFGTSGHRGSSALHSFNEAHIIAIAQAVYEQLHRQYTNTEQQKAFPDRCTSEQTHMHSLNLQ